MGRWDKPKQDKRWNHIGKRFIILSNLHTPQILKKASYVWSKKMQKYIITLTFKQWAVLTAFFLGFSLTTTIFGTDVIPYRPAVSMITACIPLFLTFAIDDDDDDEPDEEPKDDGGIIIKSKYYGVNNRSENMSSGDKNGHY